METEVAHEPLDRAARDVPAPEAVFLAVEHDVHLPGTEHSEVGAVDLRDLFFEDLVPDCPRGANQKVGWEQGLSEKESWEAGRGVWRLDAARALDQGEVQIINSDGTIVAVAEITGIIKHGDRREVQGRLLDGDPRVGTQTAIPYPSRNPISYDD